MTPTNSNADELQRILTWVFDEGKKSAVTDRNAVSEGKIIALATQQISEVAEADRQSNYLPKAKVVEANAWLEEAIKPHDGNDMVADLIQEYKRKLGLESKDNG